MQPVVTRKKRAHTVSEQKPAGDLTMENGPFLVVYLLKMVIFHFATLAKPEGPGEVAEVMVKPLQHLWQLLKTFLVKKVPTKVCIKYTYLRFRINISIYLSIYLSIDLSISIYIYLHLSLFKSTHLTLPRRQMTKISAFPNRRHVAWQRKGRTTIL